MKIIRVLIVTGAVGMRNTLGEIVASGENLSVMGTVTDPYVAAKFIAEEIPDVILLDLETPNMDGLTFLKKIMTQCPLPIIVFSIHAAEGSLDFEAALQAGAWDFLILPRTRTHLLKLSATILETVETAGKMGRHSQGELLSHTVQPKLSADVILPPRPRWATVGQTERIICMGVSTGGTDSLQVVLQELKPDCAGIVIVQHMPKEFTHTFSERLHALCEIAVKEAEHGDLVLPGTALVAPGSHHVLLVRRKDHYAVELNDGPLVTRHRPSVDVLFRSAARVAGSNALGIIMTGMGDDGARGLLEMRQAGARTIAEDESTCVVFGMPQEAIRLGGAEMVVPLDKIADRITALSGGPPTPNGSRIGKASAAR
ncbi:MAG: chemotaxis response regulator protein-glutamate methylesterase [Magnetococcales bacterium]|nr:chemotaxis response regulator protein-glutamate methylesterase [Magnetococcales bacterium]